MHFLYLTKAFAHPFSYSSYSTVLTTVSLPYLNAPEAFSTFISYYSDSSYNININLRS